MLREQRLKCVAVRYPTVEELLAVYEDERE
jgi:hypothetical protein